MRFSIKKIIVSGLLTLSALSTTIMAAVPAAAANPSSLTLESKSVANAATFTITVNAASTIAVAGGQAVISFDAANLTCNSAAYNTATPFFGADEYNVSATVANGNINNTTGIVNLTSTTGGTATVTGSGLWATLSFTAKTADTTTNLSFNTLNSYLANNIPTAVATDLTDGVITIGTPPLADLTVSNVVANGTTANYTVSFTVNNTGTLAAPASSATIVGDLTGSPITVAVPAIASGTSTTVTSPSITISGQSDSFVVTVDSDAIITESNESNNTATGSYTYIAPPDGQTTDVNGTITRSLTFTNPAAINFGAMTLGNNHQEGTLNVKTNAPWQVTAASDIADGMMTKWSIATPHTYTSAVKLHNALRVMTTGGYLTAQAEQNAPVNSADISLSSTAAVMAQGVTNGQVTAGDGVTNNGESRTINFNQTLVAADANLASAYTYHIVVSFLASNTNY